jgi:hypothetical protein
LVVVKGQCGCAQSIGFGRNVKIIVGLDVEAMKWRFRISNK